MVKENTFTTINSKNEAQLCIKLMKIRKNDSAFDFVVPWCSKTKNIFHRIRIIQMHFGKGVIEYEAHVSVIEMFFLTHD